jgi:hypothetical protein
MHGTRARTAGVAVGERGTSPAGQLGIDPAMTPGPSPEAPPWNR